VAQVSQLVFQPALDPHHAMFRLLRLFPILKGAALSRDHVRILDFYLIFPFLISAMRLSREGQHFKKLARKYANLKPYGQQPEGPLLFARMEVIQNAALDTLAFNSFLEKEALAADRVITADKLLPKDVSQRVIELNEQQADLLEFLQSLAKDYPVLGENGLKARTGLKEHRYDAV
jgi:ABC-three component (ABC-3C) system Middle Component 5